MKADADPATSARLARAQGPAFTRVSWVSERARATWQPRFEEIARMWVSIERLSVVRGIRRAAIAAVAAQDLERRTADWRTEGLAVLPLELRLAAKGYAARYAPSAGIDHLEFGVALIAPAALDDFRTVWQQQDQIGIAGMLGYPCCCAQAFRARYERHGMRDPTWPMAVATQTAQRSARRLVDLSPATPEANILLRWLRVRAVPHLPCRFDCEASAAFGGELLALGRTQERPEQTITTWLDEALRWPIEWSALHGLAEIRTPVCRILTDTDYSRERFVVRFNGTHWPSEGGQGLAFPYRNVRPDRLTGSTGFRRGLKEKE